MVVFKLVQPLSKNFHALVTMGRLGGVVFASSVLVFPFTDDRILRRIEFKHVEQERANGVTVHSGISHHDCLDGWNHIRRKLLCDLLVSDDTHELGDE